MEFIIEENLGIKFNVNNIPNSAPSNPDIAYVAKQLAFRDILSKDKQAYWQDYWYKCCVSNKCDYIFSVLRDKNVDREDDLKKICEIMYDPKNPVWEKAGNGRREYISTAINFFLGRYYWFNAYALWNKYDSGINLNFIKIFLLPRLLGAISLGVVFLASASEIQEYVEIHQSSILIQAGLVIILIILYIIFEFYNKVRQTIVIKRSRIKSIGIVFLIGIFYSICFSLYFSSIGVIGDYNWCWKAKIFFAAFVFFIGILLQILWEDKTIPDTL